jgi:hypothetical protein
LLDRYQIFLGSTYGTGGVGSGEPCSRHARIGMNIMKFAWLGILVVSFIDYSDLVAFPLSICISIKMSLERSITGSDSLKSSSYYRDSERPAFRVAR